MRIVWIATLAAAAALAGCAAEPVRLQFPTSPDGAPLDGRLYKPDGPGRFPAVVLLPACAGPRAHVYKWADQLRGAGYVVQLVDSISARKAVDNCRHLTVGVDDVARDAVHALSHLQALPFVDGSRIAVVGFSYGGMAALRLSSAAYGSRSGMPAPGFRAAVAFYPHCAATEPRHRHVHDNLYDDVAIPLLMLLAGEDTEADPRLCAGKADALRSRGRPVSYKVYADATHSFDQPGRSWRGSMYSYNFEAVDDSAARLAAFLKEHLR